MPKRSWIEVELRATSAPIVEHSSVDDSWWIRWERPYGLAVEVTKDDLRELVAQAMIAQADEATPAR